MMLPFAMLGTAPPRPGVEGGGIDVPVGTGVPEA